VSHGAFGEKTPPFFQLSSFQLSLSFWSLSVLFFGGIIRQLTLIFLSFFRNCAGAVPSTPSANLIPVGFFETVIFNTASPYPTQPLSLSANFNVQQINVFPQSAPFATNTISFNTFNIIATGLTTSPVSVNFTSNSSETGYTGQIVSYEFQTISEGLLFLHPASLLTKDPFC